MKTEKRILSRMLAMLLIFAMLAGLSVSVRAREQSTSRQIQALPYQGEHPLAPGISDASLESQPQYEPEDPVDIIVELKEKPLLSSYVKSKFADLQSYKASHSGSALEARLLAQQQTVLTHMEQELDSQAEVLYRYTTVMNGFSVRAKYGDLELIRSLPGVQNAFVAAESRLVEPTMESAAEMSNAIAAWNAQYKGTGTTIAIIDTGLDVDHEAFMTDPTGAVYDKAGIANTMHLLSFVAEAAHGSLTAEDVYVSLKVPFAFDYADNDCDVTPDQAWNMNTASHGTHVAGIAAGYAETPEGEVAFCGVAPDAQLLIMKVFSDYGNGAYDSTTLAALEDAVSLGADVINMSLGSASGFTVSRDETVAAVYERVREAGITLMCAAGNDYDSALNNNSGYHMSLTANIDTGVVSAPATYAGAVAVASAENVVAQLPALSAGDRMITYTGIDVDIKSIAGTYEYVMIDGIGTVEDYAAAGDLSGKIAVVQRGELTFTEKVLNGQAANAAAVIIYNNIDENLNYMTVEGSSIPAVYISLENGRYLKNLSDKRLTVHAQDQFMPSPTAGQISQFSSLGVTPELTLKPEITAPGGYIYSALPESMGNYGSMSGTSMASPFMAGAAALVRQYLKDRYPSLSAQRIQEMTIQLLMSTARPLMNAESGCFYSPRMQGNGLVDVGAALETPAYIRTGPEANFDPTVVTMELGQTLETGCSIEPVSVEEQFNKIYWKSLDPRVATVEDGVITARHPGYTMITGTLTSGYDNCLMVYVEGIVKSQLQALVDQAKAIDLSACRDGQSKDAFLAALARAEAVLADDTADQTEIDAAQDALQAAMDALESRLPFTDVPDDAWYYEALRYVWQKGLMLGIEQNVFDPESPITRGQLITVLHRLAGLPQAKAPDPFSDIPENRYYTAAVAWAYENNITTGVSETLFAPEASVTREQMVTFFARYAEMEGHTVETEGNLDAFIDGGSVSTYAVTAMAWAVSAGLINGVDEATLAPQGNATRAQMATILMRYCEAMN